MIEPDGTKGKCRMKSYRSADAARLCLFVFSRMKRRGLVTRYLLRQRCSWISPLSSLTDIHEFRDFSAAKEMSLDGIGKRDWLPIRRLFSDSVNNRIKNKRSRNLAFFLLFSDYCGWYSSRGNRDRSTTFHLNCLFFFCFFVPSGQAPVRPWWWNQCACAVSGGCGNTWKEQTSTTTDDTRGSRAAKWKSAARSPKCCRRSSKEPNWARRSASISSAIGDGIAPRPARVSAKSSLEVNANNCFRNFVRGYQIVKQKVPLVSACNCRGSTFHLWVKTWLPRNRLSIAAQ